MAEARIDILGVECGSITAPAGCGKTQLIADALSGHRGPKPTLLLTHTNAGVAALRARLSRAGVSRKSYRLATIDGWIMRMAAMFPERSGIRPDALFLLGPRNDYQAIREAAAALLTGGHVHDALRATYARLIVDEYQDCSVQQHAILGAAAEAIATCILGDPMQAIFDFSDDGTAPWDESVCKRFPVVAELSTPWRWINANEEALGSWLLDVRKVLQAGSRLELREGPNAVTWIELDGNRDRERQINAGRTVPPGGEGSVVIIGDSTSPSSQRRFASQISGAVTVEAMELKDVVAFSREFDPGSPGALELLIRFAESVMTGVGGTDLTARIGSLARGTARKAPTDTEKAALLFVNEPTYGTGVDLLVAIGREPGVRLFRPAILRACVTAMELCDRGECGTLLEAAIRIRENSRLEGRLLPMRAVGSTLLVKGLEADVAVILDASQMTRRNLYVAMTRGAKRLVVCSRNSLLEPS